MRAIDHSVAALRAIGAPLRRLPSDASGQTVVTFAVVTCLVAAALVVGTSIWQPDGVFDRPPAVEGSR